LQLIVIDDVDLSFERVDTINIQVDGDDFFSMYNLETKKSHFKKLKASNH